MIKPLLFISALLMSLNLLGQVSVGVSIDKDSVQVGEIVNLSVQINGDIGLIDTIDFSLLKSMNNLLYEVDTNLIEEYLDVSILDGGPFGINDQKLVLTGNQLRATQGIVKFGVYTFGFGQLNNPIVKLKDGTEPVYLERPFIFTSPPQDMQAMLDSIDLMDIRPIMEEGVKWSDYLIYLYGFLALLVLGAITWYLKSKMSGATEQIVEDVPEEIIPAHITALERLHALDAKQLWQQGQVKEYQSELTDIVRSYIDGRYDIPAKEMTTSQIKKALNTAKLDGGQIATVTDILQIADIVKFAKGTAGPEMNQKFMHDAVEWVNNTKQKEIISE